MTHYFSTAFRRRHPCLTLPVSATALTITVGASIGTLTINNNLTLDGNVLAEVNTSVSPSNDLVVVTGVLTNTGTGTVTLNNLGSMLVVSAGSGTFTNVPGITSFTLNGTDIVISGTNGQAGDAYYLLQSTDLALPLSQWTCVATNVLGADGAFTFMGANVVTPGDPQQFYILSNTNSNH